MVAAIVGRIVQPDLELVSFEQTQQFRDVDSANGSTETTYFSRLH